jgi:LmbE family N-acetylglucosaminyl deacetylase
LTNRPWTVLAIGAHHDDIEIGCGGTLARLARDGHDVHVYITTRSGYTNPRGEVVRSSGDAEAEATAAAAILGIHLHTDTFETLHLQFNESLNTAVRGKIEAVKPDTIFTHSARDVHNDHWAVAQATMHASRHVPRVAMYRSNWYQTHEPFHPTLYFDISSTLDVKFEALRAYQTEFARAGAKWVEYFTNLARNDGIGIGVQYAEAFQVVRWLAE